MKVGIEEEIMSGVSANGEYRVVLHESHKPGEWVTHIEYLCNGSYEHGNYYSRYCDAMVNYIARCIDRNVMPFLPKEAPKPAKPMAHIIYGDIIDQCECGADTCLCQKCGKVVCGTQAGWVEGPLPAHGNVCFSCLRQFGNIVARS